ncbi:MAG: hypothetical protein INQ03_08085 [Candidatus Heimdallarchaeota archaeon]|nr:hypothetical protein [Candidatus Heimdallarchaeota archaeon]
MTSQISSLNRHMYNLFADIEDVINKSTEEFWEIMAHENYHLPFTESPKMIMYHLIKVIPAAGYLDFPELVTSLKMKEFIWTKDTTMTIPYLLEQMQLIKEAYIQKYASLSDEALMKDDTLDRIVKTLVHSRNHLGQYAMQLRQSDLGNMHYYSYELTQQMSLDQTAKKQLQGFLPHGGRGSYMWTSGAEVLISAANYYGYTYPRCLIYAVSGYAFLLNINDGLCASGPYVFHWPQGWKHLEVLGMKVEEIGRITKDTPQEQREEIVASVKQYLDQDMVVVAANLDHQAIVAYNDDSFSLVPGYKGSKPMPPKINYFTWEEYGEELMPLFYVIKKTSPKKPKEMVLEALKVGMELFRHPERWAGREYRQGPTDVSVSRVGIKGYEHWIKALQDDRMEDHWGMTFNPLVWSECRWMAHRFMQKMQQMVGPQVAAEELSQLYLTISVNMLDLIGMDREESISWVRELQKMEMQAEELLEQAFFPLTDGL